MITHHPRSPSYYDDDEPRAQTPTIYVQPSAAPWEVSDSSEAESTPATPAPRRTPSPLPEPTPKRPRHSSPPPAETPAFEFPFVDAVFAPIRDDTSPPDGGDDDNSDYTPSEAEEAEDIADDGLILLEDILEGAVVDAFNCLDERLAENGVVEGEDGRGIEDVGAAEEVNDETFSNVVDGFDVEVETEVDVAAISRFDDCFVAFCKFLVAFENPLQVCAARKNEVYLVMGCDSVVSPLQW
jgi:hypothetical protein